MDLARQVGDIHAECRMDHESNKIAFQQMLPGVNLASLPSDPLDQMSASAQGCVELLSTDCAIGWVAVGEDGAPSHVLASLDGKVVGSSRADIRRQDLDSVRTLHGINGRAFVVAFYTAIQLDDVDRVTIRVVETGLPIRSEEKIKIENTPATRIFVLGSPRSGTSQLGATLVSTLSLPWTGEADVGYRFAIAAEQLSGAATSPNEFVRALDEWNFRSVALDAARRAYFFMHSSSSFLDKTPGVAMVRAAPFMAECFPDAKFVFIRRHPIANIVSRMARFGGDFEEHCTDWATTMMAWLEVRAQLSSYLEVDQQEMASDPVAVAESLAGFLGRAELHTRLAESLSSGSLEKTGAGEGRMSLVKTNWTIAQKNRFMSICDVVMRAYGYSAVDS